MSDKENCRLVLACVVDSHPRFWVELVLWLLCIRRNVPRDTVLPVVYVIGQMPDDLLNWLNSQDVEIRFAEALIEGAPHCNKILPFYDDWAAHHWAPTQVAVVDADLYFLTDPTPYLHAAKPRAAPNNHSVPPPWVWKRVLGAVAPNMTYRPGLALFANRDGLRETHINNISAGIVVMPAAQTTAFAKAWEAWARWLVDNRALLDKWHGHVDQISFALTMESLGEDVHHLPANLNTVLHLLPELDAPVALHLTTGHIPIFPNFFDEGGGLKAEMLRPAAAPWVANFNHLVVETGEIINSLPSLRPSRHMFLNPAWRR